MDGLPNVHSYFVARDTHWRTVQPNGGGARAPPLSGKFAQLAPPPLFASKIKGQYTQKGEIFKNFLASCEFRVEIGYFGPKFAKFFALRADFYLKSTHLYSFSMLFWPFFDVSFVIEKFSEKNFWSSPPPLLDAHGTPLATRRNMSLLNFLRFFFDFSDFFETTSRDKIGWFSRFKIFCSPCPFCPARVVSRDKNLKNQKFLKGSK